MQQEKATNILSGLKPVAERVFAAVPRREYWSVGQISTEMNRQSKHNYTRGDIIGVLRTLVDAGLVTEAGLLTFKSNVKPVEVREVSAPPLKKQTPKPTLMDKFFDVATTLRKAAEDIEALAMEMDTAIKDAGKGDEKLRELQATLRSLMGEANG